MYTLNHHSDRIVGYLAEHKSAPIKELFEAFSRSAKHKLSQAQFYNIIKDMLDERMLNKHEGLVSLHTRWLRSLEQFIAQTKKSQTHVVQTLQEWENKIFEATNFQSINIIRWDISPHLLNDYEGDVFYYDPHTYHLLGDYDFEIVDIGKAQNSHGNLHYLIWWTSYLDTYAAGLLDTLWARIALTDTPPFPQDVFVAVVGDYIYEIHIPKDIHTYFEMFFQNVTDISQFNKELFHSIFLMKWKYKMILTKDKKLAEKVKQKFMKFF